MGILSRILRELGANDVRERAERVAVRIMDEVVSRASGRRVRTHARMPWERAPEIEPPPPVTVATTAEVKAAPPPPPQVVVPEAVAPVIAAAPVAAAPVLSNSTPVEAAPVPEASAVPSASSAPGEVPMTGIGPIVPGAQKRARPRARIWGGDPKKGDRRGPPPPREPAREREPAPKKELPPREAKPAETQKPAPVHKPAPLQKQPVLAAKTIEGPATKPATLPERTGLERCVLMARDPVFGHVYWELSSERIARARAELGGHGRGILRLIDIEHDAPIGSFEVNAERGRYVFRFPESDRRYAMELAVQASSGQVIVLWRSNIVAVPPNSARGRGDIVFTGLETQRAVLARALDLERTPRLAVELPNPAGSRRPGRLLTTDRAQLLLSASVREAMSARGYFLDGGSEPRLSSK